MNRPSKSIGGIAFVAAGGAGLLLAACGGSSTSSPGVGGGAAAAYTLSTADVSGLGTVLVNGDGRTIYTLSSEAGGKLTCTDENGCTKVWPDTELPSGVTSAVAGSGVQSSQLGTVKTSSGSLYVTYGGYPLYTYTGDSGPMQNHGQGINSFGGTWHAIDASGKPVTTTSGGNGGY
jgi:predicted lipoprotein with Yx(FWY)xxD motif